MLQKLKLYINNSIYISFFIAFFTSVFSYIIASYLQIDGFSLIETSIISILPGIIYFIFYSFLNLFYTNKILFNLKLSNINISKSYLIFSVFLISMLIYFLIDFLFYKIDSSISYDYAMSLKNFLNNNNNVPDPKSLNAIDDFSKMPFSQQNAIATLTFGLISLILSFFYVKKSGRIFFS